MARRVGSASALNTSPTAGQWASDHLPVNVCKDSTCDLSSLLRAARRSLLATRWRTSRSADCLVEQVFDLGVHTAQIVARPLLERVVQIGVDAEQVALASSQWPRLTCRASRSSRPAWRRGR